MAALNPERKMELDSRLTCPACKQDVYRIFRRQIMHADGSLGVAHESVLWPAQDGVLPPLNPEDMRCRCGEALRRVAP